MKLRIDVWSDIACPWCHVGKRHLEAALERFRGRDAVDVIWRAFELEPAAPREPRTKLSYADRIAKKYDCSPAEAQARIDRMSAIAAADGLDFRFDLIQPQSTFDAHRLLHLARDRGVQDAVKERLLVGYLSEGAALGNVDTLVRLGADAGLDPEEIRATLTTTAYADDVREDEREASELGIRGVPFFVIGGRWAVPGAQPPEIILDALEHAWQELAPARVTTVPGASGSAEICGPDSCDVPRR